jgi:hypothetical protein
MKKYIGIATLLGAMCLSLTPIAPAYAANWVYVYKDTENAVWYYDSETIRRSESQVTVWEKIDHSRDKTVKQRKTISRYRYDCAERTRTLLELTNYYPDGKNETYTWEAYEQKERAVTPDTAGDAMFRAVCR